MDGPLVVVLIISAIVAAMFAALVAPVYGPIADELEDQSLDDVTCNGVYCGGNFWTSLLGVLMIIAGPIIGVSGAIEIVSKWRRRNRARKEDA